MLTRFFRCDILKSVCNGTEKFHEATHPAEEISAVFGRFGAFRTENRTKAARRQKRKLKNEKKGQKKRR